MTTSVQWCGSVEALAEDLRAIVPADEWPKFIALLAPRAEPRPMPAYLARFPAGPGAPAPEPPRVTCECDPRLPARDRCSGRWIRCNAGLQARGPTSVPSPHSPGLSSRARKVLVTLSIADPSDVVGLKRTDFLKVSGCGTKTLAEVIAWAGEHGAHLSEQPTKRG